MNKLVVCASLRFQGARCHEFGDEYYVFLAAGADLFPVVIEADNVRVAESLQHLRLFLEALPLRTTQLPVLRQQQNRNLLYINSLNWYMKWIETNNKLS